MTPVDLIDQAAPATRRVPVCVDEDAERAWLIARKQHARAVAAGVDVDRAAEALDAAVQAAAESTIVVTVRALSAPEVQQVLDENPPRIVNDQFNRFDLQAGYNRATYKQALIATAIEDPILTAGQWAKFVRVMTAGQFDALYDVVDKLASRITPRDLPFESAASEPTRD